MIHPGHLKEEIIRPVLHELDMSSPAAVALMLGTAFHESTIDGATCLKQVGGPALGVFQIEATTERDVWDNYLIYHPTLQEIVRKFLAAYPASPTRQLPGNLYYSCAIARLIYYRRPEPLPDADDLMGLAEYWKAHYNTHLGKGTASAWHHNYKKYVG